MYFETNTSNCKQCLTLVGDFSVTLIFENLFSVSQTVLSTDDEREMSLAFPCAGCARLMGSHQQGRFISLV